MGIQLGIKGSKLKTFEKNYSSTCRCLMETTSYWLDGNTNVPVSWESVVTVLKDPSVDESGIAKQIQEKYCSKKGIFYDPQLFYCYTLILHDMGHIYCYVVDSTVAFNQAAENWCGSCNANL